MCAGPAVRQEYRRSLEQGRAGACPDPSFTERLRQRLRAEPGLLRALQDDAGALLARGLWGRRELEPALRGLTAAFELLERAALNLYLFPWRKEFGTVQVSGRRDRGAGGPGEGNWDPRCHPAVLADLLRGLRALAAGGAARS